MALPAAAGFELSAEEWLDQLQIECDIKNAPRRVRPA
jgi:hypothetical protein